MACSCHGIKGEAREGRMRPDEPCTMCAYKHLLLAYAAYNELSYEADNRDYVAGQMRLAVEHLKIEHREFALALRDLSVAVEQARDSSRQVFSLRLLDAVRGARELVHADHADIKARTDAMKDNHADFVPDIIIPLGTGSKIDNEELRMLLRSIEANLSGYGRVFIVTTNPPEWLNTDAVSIVPIADKYTDNKDANLHLKTLETIKRYDIQHFLWCADDNVFMQPVRACDIPILRNHRPRESFDDAGGRWRARVKHTFDWAESIGARLDYNYEVHAPQVFDARKVLAGMAHVDYVTQPGLTIYTAWRVVSDTWRESLPQGDYKITLEACTTESVAELKDSYLQSRMFLGYNDVAVGAGIIARLRQIFPRKSRFEK